MFQSILSESTSSAKLLEGNPDSDVAVITLWTKAKDIAEKLKPEQYAVIGQLFSAERGLDLLFRNLLANPQIRRLAVTGVDFSKSGIVLQDFFKNGFEAGRIAATDTDIWKVKSQYDGYVGKDIPAEALESLRKSVSVVHAPSIAAVDFNSIPIPAATRERQLYPKEEAKTKHYVGEYTGHRVQGKTVAEAWLNVLDTILKFGKVSGTHYGSRQKEVLNLLSVITEEDPDKFFVPDYLPCNEESIREYIPRITQNLAGGIGKNDYTYGSRMRSWFGSDQVKRAVAKLAREPISRAVVIGLWDPTKDLELGGSPCLNHIWLRISDDRLYMTAVLRSHDMFEGYPENAFGLRALQEHIRKEWLATQPAETKLGLGHLMLLSQSAHLYEDTWNWAQKVAEKHLAPLRRHLAQFDPRGNFIISTDPEAGKIVVEHTTPDKVSLGLYWAKTAAEMRDILARENVVSLPGHAIDLGSELQKAELSLKLGIPYRQDQPLDLSKQTLKPWSRTSPMIIPDHEIRALLKSGKLQIDPLENAEEQIQAAWIDLRLGNEFQVFKTTAEPFIDSRNPKEYTQTLTVDGKPFIIHPGEFVLGITVERIGIPGDHAAYIDGRSSLGRLGVTAHITAGWIDPGFSGKLVLEISNLGRMPVMLYPGMRICKLLLFKLNSPAELPYNLRKTKYQNQDRVQGSKLHEDRGPSLSSGL